MPSMISNLHDRRQKFSVQLTTGHACHFYAFTFGCYLQRLADLATGLKYIFYTSSCKLICANDSGGEAPNHKGLLFYPSTNWLTTVILPELYSHIGALVAASSNEGVASADPVNEETEIEGSLPPGWLNLTEFSKSVLRTVGKTRKHTAQHELKDGISKCMEALTNPIVRAWLGLF